MTTDELESIMRKHLEREGKGGDYIQGYVEAMQLCGYLKPRAPEWIRRSGAVFYAVPRKRRGSGAVFYADPRKRRGSDKPTKNEGIET